MVVNIVEWIEERKRFLMQKLAEAALQQRQTDVDMLRGAILDYDYLLQELFREDPISPTIEKQLQETTVPELEE